VIPNFSLAGPVLSRNHGLATFVHERLEWSLVDQSSEQSDWVVVRRRRRMQDHYRPQTSTLAIRTYSHTNIPTSRLYVGDFNCQHVNWGYNKTSPDGESLDSWATSNNLGLLYNAKETASFSHWWNVCTNPDLAFMSFGQDSQLPYRRFLGKFLRSQHCPSLITPPKLKVPAHSNPVKHWKFRKADWKRFCLRTSESIERLPPLDTSNIEGHTRIFARAYYLRPNNASHVAARRTVCHAATKSARPSIAPSSEPQWGLTLIELFCPYYLGSGRRSRGNGRKLSILLTSRTLAARHGESSTNLLAGLDAPFTSAPSWQTPSPRNSWRTGTQDWGPRVYQAGQQGAVLPMEDSHTCASQYLWTL